jgi:hypothetical protein
MQALAGAQVMASKKGRPKRPSVETIPVRLEASLARKAKYLAAEKGITITEILDEYLRGPLDRDFAKAAKNVDRAGS